MKQRSTTPSVSKQFATKSALVAAAVLMTIATPISISSSVLARDFDAEIRARQQEASAYSGEAGRLGGVAATLEAALQEIQNQVNSIQASIDASQRQHDTLVKNIEENQVKIDQNRNALASILADMYVDDQISPLEMIASSKNIGDFLDKQEYRNSIQRSLASTIKRINALQRQLENDKKKVEVVIKEQEGQRAIMAAKQQEQAQLVAQTRSDENSYKQLAAEKNAQADSLRQQQIAANLAAMRSSGGSGSIPPASSGNGGYPDKWANAPINAYVDNWGMYSRQCTSYVAFRVGASMPGWGYTGPADAKNWPSRAASSGIATGSTPRAGAAAVSYAGPYGHVMYVESVNGSSITVSDYNLGVDGLYRNYTRSASGLTYIYF